MNNKELRTEISKTGAFEKHVSGFNMSEYEHNLMQDYFENHVTDPVRFRWYSSSVVLFEIAKLLKGREANFQNIVEHNQPVRWLNIGSFHFLCYNYFQYDFLIRPLTIHRSLATYKDMPHFPDGPRRGDKIREIWTEPQKYYEAGTHRDIGFDIDATSYEEGRNWAVKLAKLLDEYNVRYSVAFSGKKGWHFILADSPQMKTIKETAQLNSDLAEDIMEKLDIIIDLVPCRIPIAYFKCAYGLDPRNNRVILPLTKEQFQNFDLGMVEVDYVLQKIPIRDRGMCIINTGNEDNVRKLMEAL